MKHKINRILLTSALLAVPFGTAHATEYTWSNLTSNGWLTNNNGYDISAAANWGGAAPDFATNPSATDLMLSNTSVGHITLYAGSATRNLNSITAIGTSTAAWRINSGLSTLNFTGTAPTVDVQGDTQLRLEVKINAASGLTKTGTGTLFSNLQITSAGFTGAFDINQGLVITGNNFGLGDQKIVNIASGGGLSLNGQSLGSSVITGGTTITRNYTLNIAGTGSNALGAIYNNGADVTGGVSGLKFLALTADASVGGTGRYDFATGPGGSINGAGYTLTKIGTNEIWVRGAATNISYAVSEGTLVISDSNSALGSTMATVNSAATLASSGTRSIATPVTLHSGSTLSNRSGTATWSGSFSLSDATGTLPVITSAGSATPTTISGVMSGDGGFQKSSDNTLTLTQTNTYKGLTDISAGTLALGADASISQSKEIRLAAGTTFNVSTVTGGYILTSGQTLSGAGTIVGDASIAGTHSPGFSPGLQTFANNLTYTSGSSIKWELAGNTLSGRSTNYDAIDVSGNLNFSGSTSLTLSFAVLGSSADWSDNLWSTGITGTDGWKIFSTTGTITGFDNLNISSSDWLDSTNTTLSSARPGYSFSLYQAADGIYLNYGIAAVPEPSAALLGGLGVLALFRRRRA